MGEQSETLRRGVVTPEAVQLDFPAAAFGTRALARLLDGLIQGSLFVGLAMAVGVLTIGGGVADWLAIVLVLLAVFLLTFAYPAILETVWRGRTPGKAALGLRVVTREGAPIQFRHAAIRSALGLIEVLMTAGLLAATTSLLSRQYQRLGDHVAGTIVLRERESLSDTTPARFGVPPGAQAYADTLDPSVLRPKEYQAVRTFLLRANTLDAAARGHLAQQLANPLAVRLGHQPPPQVTPEQFLLALATRYQNRTRGGSDGGQYAAPPGQDFGGQSVPPPPPP